MDISVLSDSALFKGFEETDVNALLDSLNAREKKYRKGMMIFHSGDVISTLCFVMTGSVTIESNDMWGNRTILNLVGKGQFFAESYALLPNEPMLVDVCANEDCTIISLDMRSIVRLDESIGAGLHTKLQADLPATLHTKLLANLLMITTRKNLHLSSRSFHTAPRQVRGRIMAYLNTVSVQMQSHEFDIPFDRQQLADYLNVERSVLSHELGKMQRDGLIRCRKNHFEISA